MRTQGNYRITDFGVARKAFLAFFAALLAVLALAPQANAQATGINEPPVLPHEVVVFPQRDFVVAEGYETGERLNFEVIRKDTAGNDVTVGTASGTVAGGLLEVNHPGGVCWAGQTPDILPGDRVVVTTVDPATGEDSGNGDATTTADIDAEAAFINEETGNLEVHGTAREADGSRIPIERLEQRIINPDLVDTTVGRRDIRATSDGAELGTISYDGATGNAWTATYSDLGDEAEQIAVAGQTRVMSWMDTNAAGDRLGITIYEEDEVGGPGLGGCGAGATYGVADFGRDAVNAANVDEDLNVTGSAFNATAVTATLTDSAGRSVNANITQQPQPATGHQSWKGTFSAAQVASLADGDLTASSTYNITVDDGSGPVERQINGADKQILKDTVVPNGAGITATPNGGAFTNPQTVKLQKPAGEDRLTEIHYTTNGNQPSLASRVFGEDIIVTDDQTIRARMVDEAGNESAVRSFAYDIQIGQDSTVEPPANVTPIDSPESPNDGGVVNTPPRLPHDVTVFPSRDFVVADLYEPNTDLFFKVVRNGHTVGSARGTTDAAGLLEVNHPGGVCWTGQTPDIKAGDQVIVTDAQGNGDAVSTSDVFATGARIVGNTVVVEGTAKQADGQPFPLERLEQRIINPDFREVPGSTIGRRDIRATSDGAGLGDISYDTQNNPDGTKWTAVYTGLNAVERQLAVEGQTRIMGWMETSPADDRLGITIFEVGEAGGPGFGGCPGPGDFAVTGANNDAVNATNVGNGLEIDGLSDNASAVDVTLTDEAGVTATASAAISASPGLDSPDAQIWKAAFTAQQLQGLGEGTLTASAAYTVPDATDPTVNTTFDGVVNFEILKDTIAPNPNAITATPQANTAGGTYPSWQAITLEHGDSVGTEIRFTLNGNDPTPYSRLAESQVILDYRPEPYALKAMAIDKAGNKSAVRTFNYQIADGIPPAQPGAPDLAAASDTGRSNSDNLTNDATATFTGTAEAGSTVRVLSNGNVIGTGTASSAGGTYSVDANLTAQGPQAITVTATDAAGNTSRASAALSVNFDSSAPAAPAANPGSGDYAAAQQVRLSIANGARVFYTTNGTGPTTASTEFTATSAPIQISRTTTLRAASIDDAGNAATASFEYRMNTAAATVTAIAPFNTNTRDRTPVIRATVLDRDRALSLADISLRVDGAAVADNLISYNPNTGALSYTVRRSLAIGNVPVVVRVTDPGRPDVVRNWSFTIIR
jgi:hypothetical protein